VASVEPIRVGVGVEVDRAGVVAKPIVSAFAATDQWDILLVLGVFLFVIGVGLVIGVLVGLVVGIGSALGVCGALFILGALLGARNTVGVVDDGQ
jgi:hypothetical protein